VVSQKRVVENRREERTPVVICDGACFICVRVTFQRETKISLFFLLPRLSLFSDKIFSFSSCCGGKEGQTSIVEKRTKGPKNQKRTSLLL
jgi:hypothetical protein